MNDVKFDLRFAQGTPVDLQGTPADLPEEPVDTNTPAQVDWNAMQSFAMKWLSGNGELACAYIDSPSQETLSSLVNTMAADIITHVAQLGGEASGFIPGIGGAISIALKANKIQSINRASAGAMLKLPFFKNMMEGLANFCTENLRLAAIAAQDGEIQQVGLSLGSRGDFAPIQNLHQQIEQMAQHAVELLSAPQVKGGEYTVVLDPVLAGVFVHEAFGHLSESDFVYENDRLRQVMTLGKQFGGEQLNIVDTATVPGLRGSYDFDDEGVPATRTYLIREGKLVGRLHSRETAAIMKEKPTGNARAINYRYPPIVRMTNTFIEPGSVSFQDMIADIKEGIYVKNWYGGTTSMEMFTFSSGEAYMIRNGKIAESLRPVMLTGNVFTTLGNIDAIGDDLEMNQGGGCGKGDQMPLPVSNGSPHIRIRHCLVGGK